MTCPICDKPETPKYRPFCSERCQQVDLGKWLSGTYAVPAVELDDIDEFDIPEEGEEH